jgi:biotin carboxylase
MSCCSCFSGLSKASTTASKVSGIEKAISGVQRTDSGSWEATKQVPTLLAGVWSSPVPKKSSMGTSKSVDFEMVIEELDSDAPRAAPAKQQDQFARSHSKFEVEQLLSSPGTLPTAMSADEREAMKRSSSPTGTAQLLSKVPMEYLNERSKNAQELRRKLARGSTVVFVSAGYQGKRFIFERAAEMGVKSVIVDHPDSWSKGLVDEGIIAKFCPVDMSQSSEDVFNAVVKVVKELGQDGVTGAVDGICTFVELSVPLMARVCEALALPGFRPAAVDAARDKHATRAALKAAGLPTPKNMLIKTEADADAAGAHVGFPAVLKPVSGAASLGVKKVTSMAELRASYREVVTELSSLVVSSGALVKKTDDTGVDASSVVDLTVLLEQYLDGSEVDCDVVMSDGEWQYAAVADNGPTKEPYFNETWGLCPSMLGKDQQAALKDLSVNSVKALGFTSGIFHVECKLTSTGPHLIEVNARMGGGPVRECNRLVWGVDLVEETIFCALGIPARPVVHAQPNTCVGYCFVNAPRSGTIASTKCIEDLRSKENVLSADPLVASGDAVTGPLDGLPTWLALLVVKHETSKKAVDFVLKLDAELPVEIN